MICAKHKIRIRDIVNCRKTHLVNFETQVLARRFEKAFDMVERYVETASLRGEELSWKNYRQKYLRHTRKARTLLRRIIHECRGIGTLQPVAKSMSTPLAVVWDVETETKDKVEAIDVFKRHWKDFLAFLGHEVSRAYDVFPYRDFEEDESLCFVLMPFDKKMVKVYEEGIKGAVRQAGLKCKLARDISRSTPIIQDVWEFINRARIVIADLTDRNPNVFYELGLAHSLVKRTILISQNPRKVPFDVKHIRYIEYKDTPSGRGKLRTDLKRMLRSVLKQ